METEGNKYRKNKLSKITKMNKIMKKYQNVLLTMKRKNTRKCDSFDYIKISPKKALNNPNSLSIREPEPRPTHLTNLTALQSKDNKHYLQLPKIHGLHPAKIKRFQKQSQNEHTSLENKLLLLGYQYRKDQEEIHDRVHDYKDKDKDSNKDRDKQKQRQLARRRVNYNKQVYISKRLLIKTVLLSFGIAEIHLQKKKLTVYVQQGNNSRMVKQMLRKRNLTFLPQKQKNQANIIWTRFCDYESSQLQSKYTQQKTIISQQPYQYEQNQIQLTKSSKIIQEINNKYTKSITRKQSNNFSSSTNHSASNILNVQINSSIDIDHYKDKIIIEQLRFHNHLTNHYEISDKKSLFANLQKYCTKNSLDIFDLVPPTYQINQDYFTLNENITNNDFWFIKPGEDTNRGNGISIASTRQKIIQEVSKLLKIGKTALVQKYIDPYLYKGRKFDIRCYSLVVNFRGQMKVYWYREGYIRTCSKQFNYDITDIYAHLTNDAVQKKSPNYGKYEQSNKLSFHDLQTYLKSRDINFRQLCQDMKLLVYHSIKSVQNKLKGDKYQFSFQIFGYDFLIDKKGKVWLIEINTNPCLEFTGSLTSRVIGHMIDNSLKIALDPILGGNNGYTWKQDLNRVMEDNKYQVLI